VNLGNPAEFTMTELAEQVLALTGSSSPIEHRPLPADDPVRRRPDISRAAEVLGWEPVTDLAGGLKRTVDYFRETLAARV
jgi:UDP-glucuronate decarboxylase